MGTLLTRLRRRGAESGGDAAKAEGAAAQTPKEGGGIVAKLSEAVATIPAKFAEIGSALADPLGLNVSYTGDAEAAAAELKVQGGVFGAMASRFDGLAGAFAYMLFILLYTPCVAALGAIRQEAGLAWTAFSAGWNTLLGYTSAVAFYQIATFSRDPAAAANTLAACAAGAGLAVGLMILVARLRLRALTAAAPAE